MNVYCKHNVFDKIHNFCQVSGQFVQLQSFLFCMSILLYSLSFKLSVLNMQVCYINSLQHSCIFLALPVPYTNANIIAIKGMVCLLLLPQPVVYCMHVCHWLRDILNYTANNILILLQQHSKRDINVESNKLQYILCIDIHLLLLYLNQVLDVQYKVACIILDVQY